MEKRDTVDQPSPEPTTEECMTALSDPELQEKGLEWAARYLLFREMNVWQYGRGRDVDYQGTEARLKELFPVENDNPHKQMGQMWRISDGLSAANTWVAEAYWREFKVIRGAEILSEGRPGSTPEDLIGASRAMLDLDDKLRQIAKDEFGLT